MRILVTGATGFVGRHLVRRWRAAGVTVGTIVRNPRGAEAFGAAEVAEVAGAPTFPLTSGEDLISIVARFSPDLVVHLASRFIAEHKSQDVASLVDSNLLFGCQLAQAMVENGVKRLLNVGTSWQHYQADEYRPVCLYAATKQAFEDLLTYYRDAHGLSVLTLKLFDTFGPGDTRAKLIALLRRCAEEGTHLDMSPGEQRLNMVYIDDVVDAFTVAAHRLANLPAASAEDWAVRADEEYTLQELVTIFEKVSGKPLDIAFGKRPYRQREVMTPWKGPNLPGWRAQTSLSEGIRKTLLDH
jgi:nucleoside-diphosphate-sugar epimerase